MATVVTLLELNYGKERKIKFENKTSFVRLPPIQQPRIRGIVSHYWPDE